jgi:hypothetical protein
MESQAHIVFSIFNPHNKLEGCNLDVDFYGWDK